MLTDQQIQDLIDNVKSVTDRMTAVDAVLKSEGVGQPKVMAFRCSHSGLYFPANYIKEWGKTTGIGLGEVVVSETLDSLYHVDPPPVEAIKDPMDFLHPFQSSFAQVDMQLVPKAEYDANTLILHSKDPRYLLRRDIMRKNQMKKQGSKVASYMAAWTNINGGIQP